MFLPHPDPGRGHNSNQAAGLSRRSFFSRVSDGLCGAAMASLLGADLFSTPVLAAAVGRKVYDLEPRAPHFEPKAKSVIHLFMNGGPSQVDLFDPKPMLEKYSGQPAGRDLANDIEFTDEARGLMPSPFRFAKHGESGIEISEILPHLSQQVDDIALIRSMFTTNFNHEPAIFIMQSGRMLAGRPSLGAWVVYGLGSENENLPAYVVLDDPKSFPVNHIQNWQAGWLPPLYQGTRVRSEGSPLLNLRPREEWPNPIVELSRSLLKNSTRPILTPDPGTRTWMPASPTTSWPRGCRSRPPTRWTSPRRAKPLGKCMDSTMRSVLPTAAAA